MRGIETMIKYVLIYEQPYERDDDSPSGIGNHSIYWKTYETILNPNISTIKNPVTKDKAKKSAIDFLNQGSIVFNHFTDGDGKTYYRKFKSLKRVTETDIPISLVEIHRPIMKVALSK